MPNGRIHLKYEDFGPHDYGDHDSGTHDCKYACGCWMGSANSGSNLPGVSPHGRCLNNILIDIPISFGKPLGKQEIYSDFVNGEIEYLRSKIYSLQKFEKMVKNARDSSKIDLQKQIGFLTKQNIDLRNLLIDIKEQCKSSYEILQEKVNKDSLS